DLKDAGGGGIAERTASDDQVFMTRYLWLLLQIRKMGAANKALIDRHTQSDKARQLEKDLAEIQLHTEEAVSQIEGLKKEHEALSLEAEKYEKARQEAESYIKKNRELSDQIEMMKKIDLKSASSRYQSIVAERDALKEQIRAKEQQLKEENAGCQKLAEQLKQAEGDIAAQQEELNDQKKLLKEKQEKVQSILSESGELYRQIESTDDCIQTENENIRQLNRNLSKQNEELAILQKQGKELQEEVTQLQAAIDREKADTTHKELLELQKQYQELEDKNEKAKSEQLALQDAFAARQSELRERIAMQEGYKKNTAQSIAAANAEIESLQKEISRLEEEKQKTEETQFSLRKERDAGEAWLRSVDCISMQKDIEKLKKRTEELRSVRVALWKEMDQLSDSKLQISSDDMDQLKKRLDTEVDALYDRMEICQRIILQLGEKAAESRLPTG
ncbi:MAG: hypothetical protein Q4B15_01950, partial [Lachnospiraceae bacterium]|nr:hypothetical protein [Lachnospiraceae bacterium]